MADAVAPIRRCYGRPGSREGLTVLDCIPRPDGSSAAELRTFHAAWRAQPGGISQNTDSPPTGLPMARQWYDHRAGAGAQKIR